MKLPYEKNVESALQNVSMETQVNTIIQEHLAREGPLLPILHAIQALLGCVPPAAIPLIAEALNLSQAEVHGVVSFYHDFRQQPKGRYLVQICRAEACQSVGAEELAKHACVVLGCDFHHTSGDGEFTLEPVYCLGQCASGPSLRIGDALYARVDKQKFNRIIDQKRES